MHNSCWKDFLKRIDGVVDNIAGEMELGWYDGETLYLSIDAILKKVGSQNGETFKKLTEVAEQIAKENGLKNVRIDFNLVVNSRLAHDSTWARQYGYYFSKHEDKFGTVVTWEKVLH